MGFLSAALYLLLSFVSLLTLLSLQKIIKKSNKLAPGPTPLPLIGNLLKLGDKPHKSLAELAKTYGPIMSLKLGQINTIVISSSKLAKEVLQKQDISFSTRYVPSGSYALAHDQFSVGWLPVYDTWRNLRRIMNSQMFSSSRLETSLRLRHDKVRDLVNYVEGCCRRGETVDIGRATFTTSLNFLSNTLFSVDLADPNKDSSKEFKDVISNIFVDIGKPNLADYFPVLARIDPQGIKGRMEIHFGKIFQIFDRLIDERLELRRLKKKNDENDVLDSLISFIEKNSEEIDRNHIEHLLLDVFAAGTDTTSSTVEWAMAELLRNPKILNKAKSELACEIGIGKLIKESDLNHLPYLRAIIKETLRLHPPAPLLLPRKVTCDVELCGYIVPAGAKVLVNVWAIGRDPITWPTPTVFMPERFLESDIDVRGQDFELIPFGAGRRICPGLPLAMRMINVMLGSLVNIFDWKLVEGALPSELDMEEKFGLTLQKAQPLLAIPSFHV
uniref:Geraniol 10-hydroxylase 2 n=1 Tax=Primula forbesii TaxID=175067 RepID=A0A140HEY4_9ERIC|nr:geraniol 10-hydroxylase 2 [Primula forbesii]